MQHGLENTRKVKIKWNVTDTQQEIDEAEDNIALYVPDEMEEKCCKELTDWKKL